MSRSHRAEGSFQVTSWEETTIVDIDGDGTERDGVVYPRRGFSRAEVSYTYSGAIEGTGLVSFLIAYRPGSAPVSGFERFEGSIDGHDGSLVLRHDGEHDAEGVRTTLHVVAGMGTGGLEGLTGEAAIEIAGHSDDGYAITLAYDL